MSRVAKKTSKKPKIRIPIQRGSLAVKDSQGNIVEDYHIRDGLKQRHKVLNKVVEQKHGDAIGVYRALSARRTLGKNRLSEEQKMILTNDMEFVKSRYYNTALWQKNAEAYRVDKVSKVVNASKVDKVSKRHKMPKVRIPIQKGGLALTNSKGEITSDYHIHSSNETRRALLTKLVDSGDRTGLGAFRALSARRTVGKNALTDKDKHTLTGDMNFIKKKFYGTEKWGGAKKKKKQSSYAAEEDYEDESSSSNSSSSSSDDNDDDSSSSDDEENDEEEEEEEESSSSSDSD